LKRCRVCPFVLRRDPHVDRLCRCGSSPARPMLVYHPQSRVAR
jgi:hypothetical protein